MTFHAGKNDLDVSLLDRYCAGVASPADVARIEAWFRECPEQRHWYEQFKRELRDDRVQLSPEVRHAAWRNLIHRRPEIEGKLRDRQTRRSTVFKARTLPGLLWSFAAVLVLGVTMAIWTIANHSMRQTTTASMLTYATGNGQRATITLPDGGTVSLNVASQLRVPMDYMAGNHTIQLVGEALFDVPHHTGLPLAVVAGTVKTQVLGTKFVVRRYASDTTTLVAVREGRVAVGMAVPNGHAPSATVVSSMQVIGVGPHGAGRLQPATEALFAFATGTLVFDGTPLPAAITELDRWYNADVRLGDPNLAQRHIQGKFAAGSLADLAAILEWTFNVRVVRDGRVLTLYSRP